MNEILILTEAEQTNSTPMITIRPEDGMIMDVNRTTFALLGIPEEAAGEYVGKTIHELDPEFNEVDARNLFIRTMIAARKNMQNADRTLPPKTPVHPKVAITIPGVGPRVFEMTPDIRGNDGFLIKLHDVTQLTEQSEFAFTDPLTGIPNRRFIEQQLPYVIAHAARRKEGFSVCMIDLDQFKGINDTYGHIVGDLALQAFVQAIQRDTREEDILARYGGDEFILILSNPTEEKTLEILARVQSEIKKIRIKIELGQISIQSSIGLVHHDGESISNVNAILLIQQADAALLNVKGRERGNIGLNTNRSHTQAGARMEYFKTE